MLGSLIAHIKNWFFKGRKSSSPQLRDLRVGDFVEIKFNDPRKMGLLDPSSILTKRYDSEDLDTMTLTGIITNTFTNCNMRFVELTVTKIVNGVSRTRLYTLMEDDIKNIRMVK